MLPGWIWVIANEQVQDHMWHNWKVHADACVTGTWRWHPFIPVPLFKVQYFEWDNSDSICVSDLANCLCQMQRNWWNREKHSSEPFAFDLGSCLHPKPTIKERNLNLLIDTGCKRGAESSNHSRFSFLKRHLRWMWCTLVLTQKIWRQDAFPTWCSMTCKDENWWVCVSDNRGWRLPPFAWQNSAYCWNGTSWVVPGIALLSPSRRPLLLSTARWEECLHHKVNSRLERGYRLAES